MKQMLDMDDIIYFLSMEEMERDQEERKRKRLREREIESAQDLNNWLYKSAPNEDC